MKTLTFKTFFPYLVAVVGICTVTALKIVIRSQINSTTVALFFLLFILFLATAFGSRPALLASFLAGVCFNFFFLPPIGTLSIADPQNWIALLAFLIVAVTAGQLSAKVKNRAEEAERLYQELQEAFEKASQAEALRRSEKLKSSLLDAVTHDLRTPLTSIKASVTTLMENEKGIFLDEEGKKELLEIINEETDRLNEFIEAMVSIAKVEADELRLRKSLCEVDEIVNDALLRAKNQLQKHQILLEIEPDLPQVFVDANSLSEVLFILLDNAARYSKENSKIKVSAFLATPETIRITVEDQGRGIPKEIREKVFDKFFRVSEDAIHTTESGLGLGLAIAKGIIESQNGQIWIEDGDEDFVTRFVTEVPIENK